MIPGPIGEKVRDLLWAHYATPNWHMVDVLARAILQQTEAGTTVREWGVYDIADQPTLDTPDHDVECVDDEASACEEAASWAGGQPCFRDVLYGPWRPANV